MGQRVHFSGRMYTLLDPADVVVRTEVLRGAGTQVSGSDEIRAALARALPGEGTEDAGPLDVAATAEVVGADPRSMGHRGEPIRSNVAKMRSTLMRWALRRQQVAREAAAVDETARQGPPEEPPGFRGLFGAASREHFGWKAVEFGPAALTDDELILLTENPSWAVGALQGAWAGVLAERLWRQQ